MPLFTQTRSHEELGLAPGTSKYFDVEDCIMSIPPPYDPTVDMEDHVAEAGVDPANLEMDDDE